MDPFFIEDYITHENCPTDSWIHSLLKITSRMRTVLRIHGSILWFRIKFKQHFSFDFQTKPRPKVKTPDIDKASYKPYLFSRIPDIFSRSTQTLNLGMSFSPFRTQICLLAQFRLEL